MEIAKKHLLSKMLEADLLGQEYYRSFQGYDVLQSYVAIGGGCEGSCEALVGFAGR